LAVGSSCVPDSRSIVLDRRRGDEVVSTRERVFPDSKSRTEVKLDRERGDEVVLSRERVIVAVPYGYSSTAERCIDAAASALSTFEEFSSTKLPDGQTLRIRLFSTEHDYKVALATVTSTAVTGIGWTLGKGGESYILIAPRADRAYLDLVDHLPEFTELVLCHETIHQLMLRSVPESQFWPDWYTEGMATYLAEVSVCSRKKIKREDLITQMGQEALVTEAVQRDRAIPLERILLSDLDCVADKNEYYSYYYSLYRYLATQKSRFATLSQALKSLRSATDEADPKRRKYACAESFLACVREAFGPLEKVQISWHGAVAGQCPTFYEDWRSSQWAGGDTIVCASFPGHNAKLLLGVPSQQRELSIDFKLNIVEPVCGQAELFLGLERLDQPRFTRVAMLGDGHVSLGAFSDGKWQPHLSTHCAAPVMALTSGRWLTVHVAITTSHVCVYLDGTKALDAAIPRTFDVMHGYWGIGVWDAVASFRGLEVNGVRYTRSAIAQVNSESK
jgi:hypothetical protein